MKMQAEIIDTAAALESFLNDLPLGNSARPNLFLDLEGNNLSRHGTLSLITILVEPRHTVYLIDVHTLGSQTFTTTTTTGTTLKKILESVSILKVFFDIRHDSDALYSLYGISVGGVQDLQLMELASRAGSDKNAVNSLAKCIQRDADISKAEKQAWKAVKEGGKALFDPARGGSYAVFDQRPFAPEVERYAVQDVVRMPGLYEKYEGLLSEEWRGKVQTETLVRIAYSQSAVFVDGKHLGKGPVAWISDVPERKRGRGRGKKGKFGRSNQASGEQDETDIPDYDLAEQERDARLDEFLWE